MRLRIEVRRPPSLEALVADVDAQDILVLNLSRAIHLCVDMAAHMLTDSGKPAPTSMGETFSQVNQAGITDDAMAKRLRGAVGFRNVAVHNTTTT